MYTFVVRTARARADRGREPDVPHRDVMRCGRPVVIAADQVTTPVEVGDPVGKDEALPGLVMGSLFRTTSPPKYPRPATVKRHAATGLGAHRHVPCPAREALADPQRVAPVQAGR